jgi:hypothetical protein
MAMNQLVPQPTTATRSPGWGSWGATSCTSAAARRHVSGWDAISASTKVGCIGFFRLGGCERAHFGTEMINLVVFEHNQSRHARRGVSK